MVAGQSPAEIFSLQDINVFCRHGACRLRRTTRQSVGLNARRGKPCLYWRFEARGESAKCSRAWRAASCSARFLVAPCALPTNCPVSVSGNRTSTKDLLVFGAFLFDERINRLRSSSG